MNLAHLLLGAVVLALATWAHYAFWSWRYRTQPGEDQLLFAETSDGWRVALGRRRPRGPGRSVPVLLVHGIAANRMSLDFGLDRWSLAAHLSRAGMTGLVYGPGGKYNTMPDERVELRDLFNAARVYARVIVETCA